MTAHLPAIVRLTATSYADFVRCPRLFLHRALLRLPPSDAGRSSDQGLLVHDALMRVHRGGSCRDAAHVRAMLASLEADTEQMRAFVDRHAARCPQQVDDAAHEVDRARFHRLPVPMFLASARIDAVWIHDGLLDVRDYKTGRCWYSELRDDPSARLQAWVMGRDAQRKGLRLRLRYEFLQPEVDDDPDPWEPDHDDLDAIEEELRTAVARMWEEPAWPGVAAADVCGTCGYRSICRDSATPGEPSWPVLSMLDSGSDDGGR